MNRRTMSAVDHAWYRMDTPENLMMVHAIMWTDDPLDWDAVRSEVGDRMLERFPKFRQHPVPPSIPFGRAIAMISFTGRICPVRLVMCVISMTFVRGVMAAAKRSTITCGDGGGTGNEICLSTIPSRRSRCFHALIMRP